MATFRDMGETWGKLLMAYLLDANVLIAAKNLHYGLDFCPAFWDWLIQQNDAGRVFSIEKVGDEVLAVEDELSEWASARGDGFFLKPDATIFPSLAAVSTWANSQNYDMAAISTLQVAERHHPLMPTPGRTPS